MASITNSLINYFTLAHIPTSSSAQVDAKEPKKNEESYIWKICRVVNSFFFSIVKGLVPKEKNEDLIPLEMQASKFVQFPSFVTSFCQALNKHPQIAAAVTIAFIGTYFSGAFSSSQHISEPLLPVSIKIMLGLGLAILGGIAIYKVEVDKSKEERNLPTIELLWSPANIELVSQKYNMSEAVQKKLGEFMNEVPNLSLLIRAVLGKEYENKHVEISDAFFRNIIQHDPDVENPSLTLKIVFDACFPQLNEEHFYKALKAQSLLKHTDWIIEGIFREFPLENPPIFRKNAGKWIQNNIEVIASWLEEENKKDEAVQNNLKHETQTRQQLKKVFPQIKAQVDLC